MAQHHSYRAQAYSTADNGTRNKSNPDSRRGLGERIRL